MKCEINYTYLSVGLSLWLLRNLGAIYGHFILTGSTKTMRGVAVVDLVRSDYH